MLTTQQVVEKIKADGEFVRKLALQYIELGDFRAVERMLHIERDTIEFIFYEYPEIADLFDNELDRQANKRLQRQSRFQIFKLIDGLKDIIEEDAEEEGVSAPERLRAASILAGILQKVINFDNKSSQGAKDELEQLYEELENERKADSHIKAMQNHRTKV